jgi:hypothetical protein
MIKVGDLVITNKTNKQESEVGILKYVENGFVNTYVVENIEGNLIKSKHVQLASKCDILEYQMCKHINYAD